MQKQPILKVFLLTIEKSRAYATKVASLRQFCGVPTPLKSQAYAAKVA